ncbi:MAG: hypothetical protein U0T82_07840 [Bacteroidales bacterium]
MIFWKKSNIIKDYSQRILDSFPAELHTDVESVIDILPLSQNDIKLFNEQIHHLDNLIFDNYHEVILNKETIKISYRYYFNEPTFEHESELTDTQKAILNCIYLRHHNGFIRQKRLEMLIGIQDYFVIPFSFQLLGEYVIEILQVLDKVINEKTIYHYVKFINENPKYWQQTESRMISYWNEYYRRPNCPKLKDYIGKNIVDKIKNATPI